MRLKRIMALVWKDSIDAIRTPRLLIIILTPILISLLSNSSLGGDRNIKIGVFSPDPTQLISVLEKVDLVEISTFDSIDDLDLAMENGVAKVGVILPANFDSLLAENKYPQVDFLLAEDTEESKAIISLVQQISTQLSPFSMPIKTSVKILEQFSYPGISLYGTLAGGQFITVIWLVMGIIINGVMLVPSLIVEERERKTLDAILLTPVTYADLATSKAFVGLLYSIITSGLILLFNGRMEVNIFYMFALIILGGLSLSLIGVLIGSTVKNIQSLNSYGGVFLFLFIMPALVGLGGPSQAIKYFQLLPTYHLVQGFSRIFAGMAETAIPNLVFLIIECFVLLILIVWSFKKFDFKK